MEEPVLFDPKLKEALLNLHCFTTSHKNARHMLVQRLNAIFMAHNDIIPTFRIAPGAHYLAIGGTFYRGSLCSGNIQSCMKIILSINGMITESIAGS